MSRPATGKEVLAQAKEALSKARSRDEMLEAQAVILPIELGISLDQVAAMLGISKSWVCKLRMRFIKSGGVPAEPKARRGGRRNENMSIEQEEALDARLGRKTALASTYNLLHRHDWRKIAPDKRHPKSDPEAQDEFKKNSRK